MSWKSEIVFRNCFSDWYFCFNKPFIPKVSELFFLLLPKLEIFLTDLSISSSKAIVLLVAAVKQSISNGLIIRFSNSFFTTPTNLCRKTRLSWWCVLYLNSSLNGVGSILSSKIYFATSIPQSSQRSKAALLLCSEDVWAHFVHGFGPEPW